MNLRRSKAPGGSARSAAVVVLLLAACSAAPKQVALTNGSALAKVAFIFDEQAGFGSRESDALQGARLALETARNGGALPFEPVFVDAHSPVTELIESARSCALVVGFTDAQDLRVALPALSSARTDVIVTAAADPCLVTLLGGDLLTFACVSDAAQAATMAQVAREESWRRVAVLFDAHSDYCTTLSSAFLATARAHDDVRVSVFSFAGDVRDACEQAAQSKPEVMYVAATAMDAPRVIGALHAAGYRGPILGPDSFEGSVRDDGSARIWFTTHAHFCSAQEQSEAAQVLLAAAASHDRTVTACMALGYDAANLAIATIARAANAGVISRTTARAALLQCSRFDGATGHFEWTVESRFPNKALDIVWVSEHSHTHKRVTPTVQPRVECE